MKAGVLRQQFCRAVLSSSGSAPPNVLSLCVNQIVGNGSEQQLQRELEDVLMDPSVSDADLGTDHPAVEPGSDPLTPPPSKLEIVLPVQTAQESELNERSYRGEPASSAAGSEPPKCLTSAVPTHRRRVVLRRQSRQPHPRRGQRGVQPADLPGLCLRQRPPQRGGGPAHDEHPQRAVPGPSGRYPVCARRV